MSTNTPVISKAKATIKDHLDWADVHLRELQRVLSNISNSDFHARCGDVFKELTSTPPHFTMLCRKPRIALLERPNADPLNFDQIARATLVDPSLQDWVSDHLDDIKRVTKTTVALIHDRDGVELKHDLRRKFPADWLRGDGGKQSAIYIPGRTLEVGDHYPFISRRND